MMAVLYRLVDSLNLIAKRIYQNSAKPSNIVLLKSLNQRGKMACFDKELKMLGWMILLTKSADTRICAPVHMFTRLPCIRNVKYLFFLIVIAVSLTRCDSPTQKMDEMIEVNKNSISELQALRQIKKFREDDATSYVGLLPENMQPAADQALNKSIERLIAILQDNPTKDGILEEYRIGLADFEEIAFDTEDRERVCGYYDQIRIIIGFESTDGILNEYLYW